MKDGKVSCPKFAVVVASSSEREHLPDDIDMLTIQSRLRFLLADAAALGLVIEVHQEPLQPLAMGNHMTVGSVRAAHHVYRMAAP